jgi:hypothetical protein
VDEEHQMLREKVALENGFSLYRQYAEKEAAAFIKRDLSTLKRWRRKGMTRYVPFGEDGVRYLGIHIADMIIRGTGTWPDDNSPSANILSPKGPAPSGGTEPGTTSTSNGPIASAWARKTLR